MAQVRTKKLVIDGAEFIISSLTVEQVEKYLAPFEAMAEGRLKEVKGRTYTLLCCGLNNVHRDDEGNLPADYKPWTEEDVPRKMDLVLIDKLSAAIIEFSGLKLVKIEGEQQAAADLPTAVAPTPNVM